MKIRSSVSYCLLLLFFFAGALLAQDMKPDAAKLYNDGNKMLKEGKYQGAIDNYDQALKIDQDYRIYYQKGVALKGSGQIDQAKDAFEACLKVKPDFASAYNALGGIFFIQGQYAKAAENFEKVVSMVKNEGLKAKISQNIALAYTKLGDNASTDGSPKKAIDYLEKAVASYPYDAAYLSLAKIYSETGENDKAINAAEAALKNRKTIGKGGPYYYMGVAYKKKGDVAKAKNMFDQAKSDPTYKKVAEYELTALK